MSLSTTFLDTYAMSSASSSSSARPGASAQTRANMTEEEDDNDEQVEAAVAGLRIVTELAPDNWKREVGDDAVWSLSSAKPGNGVEQLRDGRTDTFWQSDGMQPHLITLQFHRKTRLQEVALYLDHQLDESYTPSKISVRVGTDLHDLRQVQCVELTEPSGWAVISIGAGLFPKAEDEKNEMEICRTHILQIAILASHQNGRDTHVRQVKVFGPKAPPTQCYNIPLPGFTSSVFHQYSTVR